MEELQARHRKELRDLQSRITRKKKSATKKTRKGVNDECATLERELNERHQAEILQLNGEPAANGTPDVDDPLPADDNAPMMGETPSSSLSALQISDNAAEDTRNRHTPSQPKAPPQSKKPNRQKARLARRAAEQEAQATQATEEALYLPNLREQEQVAMEKQFKDHNLLEREIRPDGHCLYSAVASQLRDIGVGLSPTISTETLSECNQDESCKLVRVATAKFMEDHADDFAPFLEEPFDDYVAKIKDTAEWGGQLELQAIARAYGVDINVLQARGRTEKVDSGHGSDGKQIWLAYYHHYFGLGEHYNALKSKDSIKN
jgi:OTU domain-containing protein 6